MLATISATASAGSGNMATTRAWSAPELFSSGSKTSCSDMYAFGVFMWELMTCLVPFHDTSPDLIGDRVKAGARPPIPSPLPEGFPPAFVDLMMRCLHQDPQMRPSAQDAHRSLLQIDSTARPSVPVCLFDSLSAAAPASLSRCVAHAMQAGAGQPNAHLLPALDKMVDFAAEFVRSSASVRWLMQQHQISDMEAQTVCLYTIDARDYGLLRENSIFFMYNAALRSAQEEAVTLWAVYSFLFCSALDKLPSVAATVFRGLDLPLTQLSHMYSKDSTVWLNAVTSTATDKNTALVQFGEGAYGRPGTLLQIKAVDAKDIQAFSTFPESELLLPPNSCHTVQTVLESAEVRRLPSAGIYCCFSRFPVCSLDHARCKRFRSSAAFPQALI
jgi:serine/threonine protein kinase